jgi:hypothetical protein
MSNGDPNNTSYMDICENSGGINFDISSLSWEDDLITYLSPRLKRNIDYKKYILQEASNVLQINGSPMYLHQAIVKFMSEINSHMQDGVTYSKEQMVTRIVNAATTTNTFITNWLLAEFSSNEIFVATEGKIQLNMMLDFILFVEQIIYSQRNYYLTITKEEAINNICRVLDDWLDYNRPEEIIPIDYEYLVRWFKWWAEGEKNKHLKDPVEEVVEIGEETLTPHSTFHDEEQSIREWNFSETSEGWHSENHTSTLVTTEGNLSFNVTGINPSIISATDQQLAIDDSYMFIRVKTNILNYFDPIWSGAILFQWKGSSTTLGWTATTDIANFKVIDGLLYGEIVGDDPSIVSQTISVNSQYNKVRIKLSTSTSSGVGQIYFITNNDPYWNEAKHIDFPIITDGFFHDYEVDMSSVVGWNGTITKIRIDPGNQTVGGSFAIDNIVIGKYEDPSYKPASVTGRISFILDSDEVWSNSKSQTILIPNDNEFHDFNIQLQNNSNWVGTLKQLKFTVESNVNTGGISIDYIKLRKMVSIETITYTRDINLVLDPVNGYESLLSIKNNMVWYFETRWGNRIVEYGPEGMYIYSKDKSIINKIRGKKNQQGNRFTRRGGMKKEYNISHEELPKNNS